MYHSVVNVKTDWNVQDVNMSSLYANGKQIITNEEYENAKNEKGELAPEKESEMKLKIAAKLAAGDKITVRRDVPEKPLSLEVPKSKENSKPELTESVRAEEKTAAKSIFAQTAEPNKVIYFTQPKGQAKDQQEQTKGQEKDQQEKPMTFLEFLKKLFEKLYDAIKELGNGKTRTLVTYIELVEINPHAEKKNLPNQKTNEKTLNKNGKSL